MSIVWLTSHRPAHRCRRYQAAPHRLRLHTRATSCWPARRARVRLDGPHYLRGTTSPAHYQIVGTLQVRTPTFPRRGRTLPDLPSRWRLSTTSATWAGSTVPSRSDRDSRGSHGGDGLRSRWTPATTSASRCGSAPEAAESSATSRISKYRCHRTIRLPVPEVVLRRARLRLRRLPVSSKRLPRHRRVGHAARGAGAVCGRVDRDSRSSSPRRSCRCSTAGRFVGFKVAAASPATSSRRWWPDADSRREGPDGSQRDCRGPVFKITVGFPA
jgi:hypothetical protein